MKRQLSELWQYAQKVAAAELDDDHDPSGFDKIDSEKVTQTIATINEALKDKPEDKKVRQSFKKLPVYTYPPQLSPNLFALYPAILQYHKGLYIAI